ncbi:MAG: hypothetical protein HRF44_10070 [Ignavibacterium sp.]|jgi:hypothetical protein
MASSVTIRQRLARWREFFFAQKYRFDLGQSFLVVVNFTLLIITASDKLQVFFGIPRLRSLLILIVPLGFLGVWVFGYFMDKVVRAAQMAERQAMKRSEVWLRHNEQMDRLEGELKTLRELVERLQHFPRRPQGGPRADEGTGD